MSNPSRRHSRLALLLPMGLALILTGCSATAVGPAGAPSPSPTATAPAPTATATPAPCQTSQLKLSMVESGSASGRLRILYTFTNDSTGSCTLKGYPAVTNVGPRLKVDDVTQQYTWMAAVEPLTLQPAASAYFAIQIQPSAEFAGDSCATATPTISPPGNTTGFAAPAAITTCNGVIYVSPLVAAPDDL